jgi:hypothetical protein
VVVLTRHRKSGKDLERWVLNYFVRNPNASDTVEGLARWRLLELDVHYAVEQTKEAINELIQRGFVEEVKHPGLAPQYKLVEKRMIDAEKYLDKSGDDGE